MALPKTFRHRFTFIGLIPFSSWWDGLYVHHRIPLEWSHLFPKADANRAANLIGMKSVDHTLVTNVWNAWRQGLNGRIPTQAEVLQQALRIDEQFGNLMKFLP